MDSTEEIVISGISGRFPECENIDQFWKALFDGVDLLTVDDRRFRPGIENENNNNNKSYNWNLVKS